MINPVTFPHYLEMVDQALFELSDLRESIEYDAEGIVLDVAFIDILERGLKKLHAELSEGKHVFGGDDLAFMAVVAKQRAHQIPFKRLLEEINYIHRHTHIREA